LACTGIIAMSTDFTSHIAAPMSQDWNPIKLPTKAVYGYCRQDRNHGEGVRFSFEPDQSKVYRLAFSIGGKGDGSAVILTLNGTVISKQLSLPKGWGEKTSILLPTTHVINGRNIVEVLLKRKTSAPTKWGIKEVQAIPVEQSKSNLGEATTPEAEKIITAIQKQNISGQELAHYYRVVTLWGDSNSSLALSFDRKEILDEIEKKMTDILQQVAFDVRSRSMLTDQSIVRQLLDETGRWIPGDWLEGWEIYNELKR